MRKGNLVLGDFHGKRINLVNEKDSREDAVLFRVVIFVVVPARVPRISGCPLVVIHVVFVFQELRHQRTKALRKEIPIRFNRLAVGKPRVLSLGIQRGNRVVHLGEVDSLSDIVGRNNLDEILKQPGGSRVVRDDFRGPVQGLGSVFRPKAHGVDNVRGVKVGRVFRVVRVNVAAIPLDALSHGNVKVSRYSVDGHVSRQIAPLALGHLFGIHLVASLSNALFRRVLQEFRLPLFVLVGLNDLVAGLAALTLCFTGPITGTAIVFGQIIFENRVLLFLFFGVLVEFDGDFLLGIDRTVLVQTLLDHCVINV
mmetsp:Transcript_11956/g.30330  ORF Transcript_11956/g.30330 Transcript_11956/m.30330 type:complete len:311 (-) Transcript_11956:665-1597(-)